MQKKLEKRYYQESYEGTFYYFAGCMNVLCMHWAYELSYEPQSNNASSHLFLHVHIVHKGTATPL
jgi:hypothetical protein